VGKLEGKIALVTGGTSGIGLATVKRFVAEGAFVFVTGRRKRELATAVSEVGSHATGIQGEAPVELKEIFAHRHRNERDRIK
jgi:NAD(P)-dependent dehydrogenase (short-subunit alcohol dehydrogenase family)